jgi:fimbrial chaperone protein
MLGRFLLTYGFLFSSFSWAAFDISPIVAELKPSGYGSTATFTLVNPSQKKVPVQITIVKRDPDVNGKEIYSVDPETEKLFQVYPSQVVLNANETRSLRITWVGPEKVTRELAFRLIAEELAIDVDDPSTNSRKAIAKIGIQTKYIGSLYVTPAGGRSVIEVSASVGAESENEPQLILDVVNSGTVHQVLKKYQVKLLPSVSNKEIELDLESLKKIGAQNILAGKIRRFTLPWPKGVPVGPLKVSFVSTEN